MRTAVTGAAAAALCGIVLACTGCTAPHLQNRLDDAAEIVRFNVGVGPGVLLNLHLTRAIAIGGGMYEARRYGVRNGHGWVWDERRLDANLVVPIWGWEEVRDTLYGSMPVTLVSGDHYKPGGPGRPPGPPRWPSRRTLDDPNRGWLELSANLHFLFLGIDLGLDLGELVDFAAGWMGLDPAGDDDWKGKSVAPHDPSDVGRRP